MTWLTTLTHTRVRQFTFPVPVPFTLIPTKRIKLILWTTKVLNCQLGVFAGRITSWAASWKIIVLLNLLIKLCLFKQKYIYIRVEKQCQCNDNEISSCIHWHTHAQEFKQRLKRLVSYLQSSDAGSVPSYSVDPQRQNRLFRLMIETKFI